MTSYAIFAAFLNLVLPLLAIIMPFGDPSSLKTIIIINAALAWCAVPALAGLSSTPWREAAIAVAAAVGLLLFLFLLGRSQSPISGGMYDPPAPTAPMRRWVCPNGTIHFTQQSPCPGGTATD
jgi:ABC-type transport system involved in multi-copper enzyme maturation permease subunit